MNNDHWIFLTEKEAKNAIAIDFQQYGSQIPLFHKLAPLILGTNIRVIPEGKNAGVWVPFRKNRMTHVVDDELQDLLLSTLEAKTYPLSLLSKICSLVFQARAIPEDTRGENGPGIWIEIHMAQFECKQCGKCCMSLDYSNECTEDDYSRWQVLGRTDILDRVLLIPRKDNKNEYKIWLKPGTHKLEKICPWLEKIPSQNKYRCLIQDVKPEICRDYPYTRKHAMMTGCTGKFENTDD